jgi:5-(carboxyamino)imidazole ribonucleotide synthase
MKRVGILGGGQLGMLLGAALRNLGARPIYYDASPDAPAARQLADTVTAPWTDEAALARFISQIDVLTYEFENVDATALRALQAKRALPLAPSLEILETTQNRIREKAFLHATGLPHVPFRVARTDEELRAGAAELGYPVIVKSAAGGYDGKGQYLARDESELLPASGPVVIETPIALTTELSCIVARAPSGEETTFPVFENLHAAHILDRTVVPARISPALADAARSTALEAARALRLEGLLTVEFFVGAGARLYVNELAPRPHNSGHVTLKACSFSQFDALARVLFGAPLGAPRLSGGGAYCMGNLLGDVWLAQGQDEALDLSAWAQHPRVLDVTLYGKPHARARRKMGHFICIGDSADAALDEAARFRAALTQKGKP